VQFFYDNVFNSKQKLTDAIITKCKTAFNEALKQLIDKGLVMDYLKKLSDILVTDDIHQAYTANRIINKYIGEDYPDKVAEHLNPLPAKKLEFIELAESEFKLNDRIIHSLENYMKWVYKNFVGEFT
jgi:hypothetical protein